MSNQKKYSDLSRGEKLERFFSDYTSTDYNELKKKEMELRQAEAERIDGRERKPQPMALEEYHTEKELYMSHEDKIDQAIRLANRGRKK